MGKFKNLVGQTFGRLTVICISHKNRGAVYWNCLCRCGNIVKVNTAVLNYGHTKSCGCFRKDTMAIIKKTHGMTNTPEYRAWASIKRRCYNKKTKDYREYGGRGICVCDRWINSFQNFFGDMGNRPSASHSIERIDSDGPYSPENCKWATRHEQANNQRSNHLITIGNKTQNMAQWARSVNIKRCTFKARLKRGWSPEDALCRPVRH